MGEEKYRICVWMLNVRVLCSLIACAVVYLGFSLRVVVVVVDCMSGLVSKRSFCLLCPGAT